MSHADPGVTKRYETTSHWTGRDDHHVDLVAESPDTVARIELNGEAIATSHNMYHSYSFPLTHVLLPHPFNTLRKMARNFGWGRRPDL